MKFNFGFEINPEVAIALLGIVSTFGWFARSSIKHRVAARFRQHALPPAPDRRELPPGH